MPVTPAPGALPTPAPSSARAWGVGLLSATLLLGGTPAVSTAAGEAPGAAPDTAADRVAAPTDFLEHGPDAEVLVAAHRGLWRTAPENSIAAIEAAVDEGAHIVEIDVQRTADGELVLMHDGSVDRTTDGTGAVADLTAAEIADLRLRVGLGGNQAQLTDHRVPTLAEAMEAVRGRALVNLDKGWPFRDDIVDVLRETDTVDHAIFKSSAPVAEVQQFRDANDDALYMHVVGDQNADAPDAFGADQPEGYEVTFDRLTDPQSQPAYLDRLGETGRVWLNSLWYGLAADYTDERSRIDPDLGWAAMVDRHGADTIQTDNPVALVAWLAGRDPREQGRPALDWWGAGTPGGPATSRGVLRSPTTVVVPAQNYSTEGQGVGYSDQDVQNRGGDVARPYEGVDLCDQQGAVVLCWIRGGEWVRYHVDVPVTGTYQVSARVSSPYDPAGLFAVDVDGGGSTGMAEVLSTTSHSAFETQQVGSPVRLPRGAATLTVRVDEDAYQNFNIDELVLTHLR